MGREKMIATALLKLYRMYLESVEDEPDSTTAIPPEWLDSAVREAKKVMGQSDVTNH